MVRTTEVPALPDSRPSMDPGAGTPPREASPLSLTLECMLIPLTAVTTSPILTFPDLSAGPPGDRPNTWEHRIHSFKHTRNPSISLSCSLSLSLVGIPIFQHREFGFSSRGGRAVERDITTVVKVGPFCLWDNSESFETLVRLPWGGKGRGSAPPVDPSLSSIS